MSQQRGSVSVVLAFMMPVLIGVAALAVDIPYRSMATAELQNAADAAALAGASALHRNGSPNWAEAAAMAQSAVALNRVDQHDLISATVVTGYWNPGDPAGGLKITPVALSPGDSPAVKVVISKAAGLNNGEIPTFFARWWGVASLPASATAVAGRTAPSTVSPGYLFPVIITDCLFQHYWNTHAVPPAPLHDPATGQPYRFELSSTKTYAGCNGGDWTSLDLNSNGTSTMRTLIEQRNPHPMALGDSVWVKPGVAAYSTRWRTRFHADGGQCSSVIADSVPR